MMPEITLNNRRINKDFWHDTCVALFTKWRNSGLLKLISNTKYIVFAVSKRVRKLNYLFLVPTINCWNKLIHCRWTLRMSYICILKKLPLTFVSWCFWRAHLFSFFFSFFFFFLTLDTHFECRPPKTVSLSR